MRIPDGFGHFCWSAGLRLADIAAQVPELAADAPLRDKENWRDLLDQDVDSAMLCHASVHGCLDVVVAGDISLGDGDVPAFRHNALRGVLGCLEIYVAGKDLCALGG